MTIGTNIQEASRCLAAQGIPDAHWEAEHLMGHILSLDQASIYTYWGGEITSLQAGHFHSLLERRLQREPLAYITSCWDFYGLEFALDRRVLVPRPETELLVEQTLEVLKAGSFPKSGCRIADVGTGCGNIAITLALHLPYAFVYALDSSAGALEVAALNCKDHDVEERVRLIQGDLLSLLPEPVDAVVANLPYIRSSELELLQPEIARYEPREALDGGLDGLSIIRRLISQVRGSLKPGGAVFLEIGDRQMEPVVGLLKRHLPKATIRVAPDLAGHPRAVSAHSLTTCATAKRDRGTFSGERER